MLLNRLLPLCVIFAITVCLPVVCAAQTEDDDIIITSRDQVFTFRISEKKVVMDENSTTDFECLKPARTTVVEFYNDLSQITRVSIKGIRNVTPAYEMYQNGDFFYSDLRVCYFTLPFRTMGETAQVVFAKRFNDIHLLPRIHLAELEFVRQGTVKIVIPAWLQAEVVERNLGGNIRKEVGTDPKTGATTYRYTIWEQPAAVGEEHSPDYGMVYPYLMIVPKTAMIDGVQVAYFNDFNALYRWCRDLANQSVNDMDIIREQARAITAACTTDEEKIKELYAWVQNNIRYLAYEDGLAGFRPDDAHEVLRKKYGDCKGMSNLLKALLTAEGFDARLVWIGTRGSAFDESAAVPTADHMICALLWNEKVWFLDPTVKYMALGECHDQIQGQPAMIEDGDRYRMETVPDFPPQANTDSLHCRYRIEGNALAVQGALTLTGVSKQALMSALHSLETHRRDDVVRKFLERGNVEDKVPQFTITGADSKSDRIGLDFTGVRRSGVQFLGDEIYVAMDQRQDFIYSDFDTVRRKTDFLIPYKEYTVRHELLEVPEGYAIARLPENCSIQGPGYAVRIDYSADGRTVTYHKTITITGTVLKKSDFAAWNRDMSALRRRYMQQVVLRKL